MKMMKDKIISKATDLFLRLGFKSITMDDIACEMCISKKTIYKFFANKEVLIDQAVTSVHKQIHETIQQIASQGLNAIEENYTVRKMFKEMFNATDTSPIYQLKKHYPEIYENVMNMQLEECNWFFTQNIEKGIQQGLYRNTINVETYAKFYFILIFSINENTILEKETQQLEFEALEYHTRAIATPKGIKELENQLEKFNQ
jgi:AcrR family transcriptional regulator